MKDLTFVHGRSGRIEDKMWGGQGFGEIEAENLTHLVKINSTDPRSRVNPKKKKKSISKGHTPYDVIL